MQNQKIEIYTDGSCLGNPGPGGFGAIVLYKDKEFSISGGEKETTNNRMEMTAVIKALEWIRSEANIKTEDLDISSIIIYSDSNLIVQTLNQGWKRKANQDLWEKIDKLRAWLNIQWIWVKAHADNKFNNKVDQLALSQAKKQNRYL